MDEKKRDAGFSVSVKRLADSERVLRFIGTTDIKDRTGEILEADSWKLKNYKKNPVFLLAHDYRSLPIGKTVNIEQTKKGLEFDVEFADKDTYPLADTVFKLYEGGFMNGVSVGYKPNMDKVDVIDGVPHFKDNELYELSAASVPANPEAVMQRMFEAESEGVVNRQEIIELTLAAKSFFSQMKKEKFNCECIKCGHKMTSEKHCKDIKCSECGGEMRRAERPGPGRNISNEDIKVECKSCGFIFDYKNEPEAGMGYVNCPSCGEAVTQTESKTGRVLSKANEKLIRAAVESITKVLDKLSVPEEPKTVKYPSFKGIYNSLLSKKAGSKSGNAELIDPTLIQGVKGLNKKEN